MPTHTTAVTVSPFADDLHVASCSCGWIGMYEHDRRVEALGEADRHMASVMDRAAWSR